MPSKENTEDQETNKRCKERDGILMKNEIVEKSLINHNFISMDLESNLKVIDCCPNERYYQFNEQIGKGSYKNVYKAYDKSSKIYVAWCETNYAHLKIRGIGKLREEIYLLSLLSHENILPLLNYWEYKIKGVKGTNVVMITEYFDAGSLKNHIKTLDCVPKCCIQTWGRQILNGISYLHNHNPPIIHRDLKCDNILYDKKCDILKICDLGYAIFKGNFNNEGVIGTPEFMAPEMFSEQYDEGVDIYAFGMCLLEMVTGEYPYQECRKPNDLYNLVTNNVKPLCLGKISNIYSDIKMIIERCIRNRRNERWNVDELLEDELFTDFNKFEIKIKSSCYKEYLLRDSPLFTLEIIGNTKRLISKDFELTFSIFTFDCEREKHFDVANRLIEDFHISVKFKYQLIEQLERYVKTRKRFIKFREIECE
uniref:WNK homolog (inferred by orthology to a D. melanogaster protein) n=1 Tax=Strongyloides venezuelensis TaxID=75913 RepID=A0A0K0FWZ3_STRVS